MAYDLGKQDDGTTVFKIGDKEFTIDLFDILLYLRSMQKNQVEGVDNEKFILDSIPHMQNYLKGFGFSYVSGLHAIRFIRHCMAEIGELKKNIE